MSKFNQSHAEMQTSSQEVVALAKLGDAEVAGLRSRALANQTVSKLDKIEEKKILKNAPNLNKIDKTKSENRIENLERALNEIAPELESCERHDIARIVALIIRNKIANRIAPELWNKKRNKYIPVIGRGDNKHKALEFLIREWGDLISQGQLYQPVLKKDDPKLLQALRSAAKAGHFGELPIEKANDLKAIDVSTSVQELRDVLGNKTDEVNSRILMYVIDRILEKEGSNAASNELQTSFRHFKQVSAQINA